MNKKMKLDLLGGLHFTQDSLAFLQDGYSTTLDALATFAGDKVILSGVAEQGGKTSPGFISYGGEALPFLGGLKAPFIIVEEEVANEQFEDNQQRGVYVTRRLKYGNVIPPTGGFASNELTSLSFGGRSVKSALSTAQTVINSLLNLEPEIILAGCLVDDSQAGIITVSPGLIYFAGEIVTTPAYTGQFPAFVTDRGLWATSAPSVGRFVTFDPYTSQHYKDVRYRSNKRTGELSLHRVLSDRFDPSTGLGKWEWFGFRLSSDARGRVPVGYWFGDNGTPNHYESFYRDLMHTGGENRHKLTRAELPGYEMLSEIIGDNGWPKDSGHRSTNGDQYLLSPIAGNKNIRRLKIHSLGEDAGHENRMPYFMTVYVERI